MLCVLPLPVGARISGVDASHVEPSVEADEHASRVKPSRAGAYQWPN